MPYLVLLLLASITGYIYGLSLVLQQGKAPSYIQPLYGPIRMAIMLALAVYAYNLLHFGLIPFILLVISFVITLWLTLLKYALT
ncbi:hypothetical protein H0X48_04660 [Candidatus Dependentiae bacterium]|nr:hypothetical protein [Candidatus Dependentiae bacterium]